MLKQMSTTSFGIHEKGHIIVNKEEKAQKKDRLGILPNAMLPKISCFCFRIVKASRFRFRGRKAPPYGRGPLLFI